MSDGDNDKLGTIHYGEIYYFGNSYYPLPYQYLVNQFLVLITKIKPLYFVLLQIEYNRQNFDCLKNQLFLSVRHVKCTRFFSI